MQVRQVRRNAQLQSRRNANGEYRRANEMRGMLYRVTDPNPREQRISRTACGSRKQREHHPSSEASTSIAAAYSTTASAAYSTTTASAASHSHCTISSRAICIPSGHLEASYRPACATAAASQAA